VEAARYVADLPASYRGATALLITGRGEGFGLPALDAMACGAPVVAFANSSLLEVVGDGGRCPTATLARWQVPWRA
jgi:glycosyltransferase involved in cell wall biosynthesis